MKLTQEILSAARQGYQLKAAQLAQTIQDLEDEIAGVTKTPPVEAATAPAKKSKKHKLSPQGLANIRE